MGLGNNTEAFVKKLAAIFAVLFVLFVAGIVLADYFGTGEFSRHHLRNHVGLR